MERKLFAQYALSYRHSELLFAMLDNKDYSKFKLEFKNTEDQILLYRLVSNSGLFTRDFDDFRLKYFKKDAALDDCIAL